MSQPVRHECDSIKLQGEISVSSALLPLRKRALPHGRSAHRVLTVFVLILSVLGCVFALHSLSISSGQGGASISTNHSHGAVATATDHGSAQTALNGVAPAAAPAALPQTNHVASVSTAGSPAQGYDSPCVIGCDIAGAACTVLAFFAFVGLIRRALREFLRPRRLPLVSELVDRILAPLRAPSLLVLSISRT